MTVEITGTKIENGSVFIYALDSRAIEERYQNRERTDEEREIEFEFDLSEVSKSPSDYLYLKKFLKTQKAVQGARTWGEALSAIVGTITQISKRYLVIE